MAGMLNNQNLPEADISSPDCISNEREGRNRGLLWILLLIWAGGVVLLEIAQFRFVDCSEMPELSIASSLPFFGCLLGYPLLLIYIWFERKSSVASKIFSSIAVTIVVVPVIIGIGFLWGLTHMCP